MKAKDPTRRRSSLEQRTLDELRDELRRIGFYAERPRRNEDTLRVYPRARHVYPLLKIGYRSDVRSDSGDSGTATTLVVSVYSKGLKGIATRLLSFRRSRDCWFEHRGAKLAGDYRQHGYFVVLVDGLSESPIVPSDALRRIHRCLFG